MLVVIEQLLDTDEVAEYRRRLDELSWEDGARTAGGLNLLVKQNQQADATSDETAELRNHLLQKLGTHPTFVSAALPHQIFPPVFNRYGVGETYGAHVDAAIMHVPGSQQILRSDVSMTLFLSSLDEYEGGELVIEGQFGAQEICLEAGDAVVYPSSSLHQVKPVTAGIRCAAITWIQSLVPQAEQRALLYDLDLSIQALTRGGEGADELLRLTSVYHNLVRQLSQV